MSDLHTWSLPAGDKPLHRWQAGSSKQSNISEKSIMQELNPYFNQIQDLQERCASLRGYL